MDLQIVKTQTNMGKECLIVDGYTFRKDSILKSGEISWRWGPGWLNELGRWI